MAGVTIKRTTKRQLWPSTGDIELDVLHVLDAFGQIGVKELQGRIWATSRFKKPTGRSTRAWRHELRRDSKSYSLAFINDAANKRGTNYPRYVHLSGRPRSDLLMYEVESWADK